MPAPAEFVNMAVGMVNKDPALTRKAPVMRVVESRPAQRPRMPAPVAGPANLPTIVDPVRSVDVGPLGAAVDAACGRKAEPWELKERVADSLPTVGDFIKAAEEAHDELTVSEEEINANAEELRDAFADSLHNPKEEKKIEESKDIIKLQEEAEDESLKALEKILTSMR